MEEIVRITLVTTNLTLQIKLLCSTLYSLIRRESEHFYGELHIIV